MDVVSQCELPVAGRVWQPRAGAAAFAVACKATFSLAPGTLSLAREQEAVRTLDAPWSANVTSLYAGSDLVPRKLRADVVLVGDVYAPRGEPVERLVARIRCADLDKAIDVFCDRTLQPDGTVIAGQRFARSQLLYERAAGGPGTDNPVGLERRRDAYGNVNLPNITAVGARISSDFWPVPIGFGPIAASWPGRYARGAAARELMSERWHTVPLPDQELIFFNAAPLDQQTQALRGDEAIVLDNLHPDHPQLEMRLPGLRLIATVQDAHGERQVPMKCDTLWIDTRRAIASLTYRTHVELGDREQAGRVVIGLDRSVSNGDLRATVNSSGGAVVPFHAAQPFRATTSAMPAARGQAKTHMFARSSPTQPDEPESDERSQLSAPQSFAVAPPIVPAPAPPPSQLPPQPPPSWSQVAAPAIVASPPSSPVALAPVAVASPWASRSGAQAASVYTPLEPVKQVEAALPAAAPSQQIAAKPSLRDAGEALELVFFDRESLPRIRRVPAWRELIAELDERPIDADEEDPTGAKDSEAIEDRREVVEILVNGGVIDASALDNAVSAGVRADGRYLAPIVLVSGELSTPFDEVETLKATVNTALPLAANDETLRAAIEDAQEFLKLPPGSSSPAVTEGLTMRIRRVFSAAKRPVPAGYLETQTERALLEQRHYQRRNVLGGARQRTVLQLPHGGGGSKTAQHVTFLPNDVASKLPLAARFRVRIIARVHLPIDPAEPDPVLEALALARLCPIPRREPR